MAAGFAHEINNPLTIIENYAFILGKLLDAPDRELADEAVSAIRDATRRAATIVDGLRKLARDDSGTPAGPEAVAPLTEEAINLCRFRFTNSGVQLDVDNRADGAARIQPVEFQQVVINLLNNAFDAVCERGDGEVLISSAVEGDRVRIAVEDNGPGLDVSVRERIFEPFFTTKPVGKGTGLGLSISRSIAQAAGGDLELDANAGRTRFVFTLPRHREAAA